MISERAQLLEQVAAGQLSAVEAARRIGAEANAGGRNAAGRWLHIRVTDLTTGLQRVQVNLPLTWVDAAMKLGARYQPEVAGLNLDWNEIVAMLEADPDGRLVEVEDLEESQRILIYID